MIYLSYKYDSTLEHIYISLEKEGKLLIRLDQTQSNKTGTHRNIIVIELNLHLLGWISSWVEPGLKLKMLLLR